MGRISKLEKFKAHEVDIVSKRSLNKEINALIIFQKSDPSMSMLNSK